MVAKHRSIKLQSAFAPWKGATCSSGATAVKAHIDGMASAAIWGSHPRTLGHVDDRDQGLNCRPSDWWKFALPPEPQLQHVVQQHLQQQVSCARHLF